MFFCNWLLPLSMMFSRFFLWHVLVLYSFLWLNTPLYRYNKTWYPLSVDRHLGCYYFMALVNNAAINILGQDLVWAHILVYLRYILNSTIAGWYGNAMFLDLKSWQTVSRVAAPFYIPTRGKWEFGFLHFLTNIFSHYWSQPT